MKLTKNDKQILSAIRGMDDTGLKTTDFVTIANSLNISRRTAYRSINRLSQAKKLVQQTSYKLSYNGKGQSRKTKKEGE